MHEKNQPLQILLAAFAKSEGNSIIMLEEIEKAALISQLPVLLAKPEIMTRLIKAFNTVHEQEVLDRVKKRQGDMTPQGVLEIFIFGLGDLTPTADILNVIAQLKQLQANYPELPDQTTE